MIKYLKILLYSALTLIVVANCIDPFYPDIEEYENVLVVDGFITNENSTYKVKLSRTQRFDDIDKKPENLNEAIEYVMENCELYSSIKARRAKYDEGGKPIRDEKSVYEITNKANRLRPNPLNEEGRKANK